VTITEIEALTFRGSYSTDRQTFSVIDTFLQSDAPVSEKVRALAHLVKRGAG
jgi:hypothetical protein